jgi:pyruvate formate lyase activating enzyme
VTTPPLTTFAAPSETCTPRIAGMLGSGMLDWPGRLAATVFLGGCNFRCPYCHNPELTSAPRHPVSLDRVLSHVREKRSWLDGVVISGGEPTQDPALMPFLGLLRSEGIPVKLDTNGSSPETLALLLNAGLVDFVALDVKAAPERYDLATRVPGMWAVVRRSIRLVVESGVDHEFRTTCYPSAVATADLPGIASHLAGGQRYVIQQFRPQRTLDLGASTVRPHTPDSLRKAALCCAVHIPTVVRGV